MVATRRHGPREEVEDGSPSHQLDSAATEDRALARLKRKLAIDAYGTLAGDVGEPASKKRKSLGTYTFRGAVYDIDENTPQEWIQYDQTKKKRRSGDGNVAESDRQGDTASVSPEKAKSEVYEREALLQVVDKVDAAKPSRGRKRRRTESVRPTSRSETDQQIGSKDPHAPTMPPEESAQASPAMPASPRPTQRPDSPKGFRPGPPSSQLMPKGKKEDRVLTRLLQHLRNDHRLRKQTSASDSPDGNGSAKGHRMRQTAAATGKVPRAMDSELDAESSHHGPLARGKRVNWSSPKPVQQRSDDHRRQPKRTPDGSKQTLDALASNDQADAARTYAPPIQPSFDQLRSIRSMRLPSILNATDADDNVPRNVPSVPAPHAVTYLSVTEGEAIPDDSMQLHQEVAAAASLAATSHTHLNVTSFERPHEDSAVTSERRGSTIPSAETSDYLGSASGQISTSAYPNFRSWERDGVGTNGKHTIMYHSGTHDDSSDARIESKFERRKRLLDHDAGMEHDEDEKIRAEESRRQKARELSVLRRWPVVGVLRDPTMGHDLENVE